MAGVRELISLSGLDLRTLFTRSAVLCGRHDAGRMAWLRRHLASWEPNKSAQAKRRPSWVCVRPSLLLSHVISAQRGETYVVGGASTSVISTNRLTALETNNKTTRANGSQTHTIANIRAHRSYPRTRRLLQISPISSFEFHSCTQKAIALSILLSFVSLFLLLGLSWSQPAVAVLVVQRTRHRPSRCCLLLFCFCRVYGSVLCSLFAWCD